METATSAQDYLGVLIDFVETAGAADDLRKMLSEAEEIKTLREENQKLVQEIKNLVQKNQEIEKKNEEYLKKIAGLEDHSKKTMKIAKEKLKEGFVELVDDVMRE